MPTLDPPLESSALRIILAFWPAVHQLEQQSFARDHERVAYVGLLRKLTLDAHAARSLAETPTDGLPFAPHSPVAVLSRSVVEAAGQFARWFLSDMSDDQRDFELQAAALAGELGRLEHVVHGAEWSARVQAVRADVAKRTLQLQQHPHWAVLSAKARGKVSAGRWRPAEKHQLLKALGYSEQGEAGLYAWMNDASHGGMRLLKQSTHPEPESQRHLRASLNVVAGVLALVLTRLAEDEPSVQAFIRRHPDVRAAIDLHRCLAQQ